MKKILYSLSAILLIFVTNSCYDRDTIESKDGVALPTVMDLKSSLSNTTEATLNWKIPSEIPSEIKRPVSVYVQVYKGSTLEQQISLPDEATTWTGTLIDIAKEEYRIVVKLQGSLKEKEYGKSNKIYSLGQTVEIK